METTSQVLLLSVLSGRLQYESTSAGSEVSWHSLQWRVVVILGFLKVLVDTAEALLDKIRSMKLSLG